MPKKGEHCSPATRRKMSAAQRARWAKPEERFKQSVRRSKHGFPEARQRRTLLKWYKEHPEAIA